MTEEHVERRRRKVTDYAGLAALITAVTASAGFLVDRYTHAEKESKTQESTYVLLDYRLRVLEARCGVLPPPPPPNIGALGHGAGAGFGNGMSPTADTQELEAPAPDEAKPASSFDFNDIQKYVERTGEAMKPEALEAR